ncbi:MFS transporter [Fischerella sp. PCC 9605]|uniref:MFS transporter n=1 Tax=Fischerella sp. PCC 9605 TaxID=1173024 RepID=UPI00047B8A39|nr:MFS transporter [Fischerella sp. PCC 9605]
MSQQPTPTSLRNFLIIWLGQLVSAIGSQMTTIALEIWAWEVTGKATTLALVGFFGLLPSILITPISGVIVDRFNRKLLMMLGDTVAVLTTIVLLFLYINKYLQIWHFYVAAAFVGTFSQFQYLAYSASISLMIPKQHYTRASSLDFLSHHSAIIIAPALAGYLYKVIGLFGILLIDISTFLVAIFTIFLVQIPQILQTEENQKQDTFWQDLRYGLRYLSAQKSLLNLLLANLLFFFAHDLGDSLYVPMILSRTGNNTLVLGNLIIAAGFGGVMGALIINKWGGFKNKIKGVFLGIIGVGLTKIVFGLGRTMWVWIPPQFLCSLSFTVSGSSDNAIWLAKVAPNVQGRVFAARSLLLQLASAVAVLIAGPLADNVFVPAFREGGSLVGILGGIFGTGTGAGIAMLYVICAVCMFLVGLGGLSVRSLRNLEKNTPDYDEVEV